jgi:cyclopropane fatty-acyl-phospholipid synthase-like methyltransferase
MPIVPNLLEQVAVPRLNFGPGPMLDLLGAAGYVTRSDSVYRNLATCQLGGQSADELATIVTLPTDAPLLDIGGSHGLNSVAICRRHPNLHATVFDQPQALASAARTVEAEGMHERITLRAGDFSRDDLGSGFGAALLCNIVHYLPPEANAELLTRVARALVPGGIVVIFDQLAGTAPVPTADAFFRILALNYQVGLGGDLYTFQDLAAWCTSAGFERPRRQHVRTAPGMSLLTARRLD